MSRQPSSSNQQVRPDADDPHGQNIALQSIELAFQSAGPYNQTWSTQPGVYSRPGFQQQQQTHLQSPPQSVRPQDLDNRCHLCGVDPTYAAADTYTNTPGPNDCQCGARLSARQANNSGLSGASSSGVNSSVQARAWVQWANAQRAHGIPLSHADEAMRQALEAGFAAMAAGRPPRYGEVRR